MKKAVRTNKVFVDWSQNDEHKTTISVYSLRAREQPTISTPVEWREVGEALKKRMRRVWSLRPKMYWRASKSWETCSSPCRS